MPAIIAILVVIIILTQVFDINILSYGKDIANNIPEDIPLTYVIGAIFAVFLLKKIIGGNGRDDKGNKPIDISELYDSEDVKIEPSNEEKQTISEVRLIENETRKNSGEKRIVTNDQRKLTLNLRWSESLGDLLEATNIVYSNAELVGKDRMNESRFHYYCKLHFRSHMADQLCRDKIYEIQHEYDKVESLIKTLNDRSNPLRLPKDEYSQVITIGKVMRMSLKLLRDRSKFLAIQTGTIRDKIGQECGKRGHDWWLERKKKSKEAEEKRLR